MRSEQHALADAIAENLMAKGFLVQRYDAYTTNSVYLKLDFGVCNSVRISDHEGKKYLKYRYNIGSHIKEYWEDEDRRFYYHPDEMENMLCKIVRDREVKKCRYGEEGYRQLMLKNKKKT